MKILLTNDDGIDAPGLAALVEAMSDHGSVVVVAPSQPVSGASHQVTVDGPLVVHSLGADRYAVDGSPADCTRAGLLEICPDVDWVMAGCFIVAVIPNTGIGQIKLVVPGILTRSSIMR